MTSHSSGAPTWWGGTLADGTVTVLNPAVEVRGFVDMTAPTPGQSRPGWSWARVHSWWWRRRSASSVAGIHPHHSTLVLVGVCCLIGMGFSMIPGMPWGAVLGAAALMALVALLLIWWRDIRPAGGLRPFSLLAPETSTPTSLVRFVHPVVAATAAWERLATVADLMEPEAENAGRVHRLLWDATYTTVTHDTGRVPDEDAARLAAAAKTATLLLTGD